MRVLLVSANFRPSIGGIERFTEVLAEGLAGRGHSVTVLCCRTGRAPRDEWRLGVRVLRVPASNVLYGRLNVPYPVPEPLALLRAVRSEVSTADVVHVQDSVYATSLPALAVARWVRRPAIVTQHVGFVPQRSRLLDAMQHIANRTVGQSIRAATRVVTLNPAVGEWVRATWGVDATTLPVGAPAIEIGPERRGAIRDQFGLARNRFLVLFVGRDVPKKGLDHVLEAADSAYDLVAVTDKPRDDTRATFLPFMEHGAFRELLGAVDAFVLPSVGEGFPIVLQEAFGAGLPSVVTFGPGYEAYLSQGDVLIVDPDGGSIRGALLRLVNDPSLCVGLAARSREVAARHFGIEPFLDAYEGLYRDVLKASVQG